MSAYLWRMKTHESHAPFFDAKALVWWLLRRFTGCMKTSLLSEAGRRAGHCAQECVYRFSNDR